MTGTQRKAWSKNAQEKEKVSNSSRAVRVRKPCSSSWRRVLGRHPSLAYEKCDKLLFTDPMHVQAMSIVVELSGWVGLQNSINITLRTSLTCVCKKKHQYLSVHKCAAMREEHSRAGTRRGELLLVLWSMWCKGVNIEGSSAIHPRISRGFETGTFRKMCARTILN